MEQEFKIKGIVNVDSGESFSALRIEANAKTKEEEIATNIFCSTIMANFYRKTDKVKFTEIIKELDLFVRENAELLRDFKKAKLN